MKPWETSEESEPFTVRISTKRAKKNLAAVDEKTFNQIQDAILELEVNPYSGDYKKLAGGKGHRRRVGWYRIMFDIDTDVRLVSIFDITLRDKAYRKF
jgi:mRNA interferase RelE/StbE